MSIPAPKQLLHRPTFTSEGRGFTSHSSSSNATKPPPRPSTGAMKCQICKGGNQEVLSCPQQNSVAKCEHRRHLHEIGLTLIFASKNSLIFWPEAFQRACFLINRLPSSICSFTSPFYLLYNVQPDYSCLRTFGGHYIVFPY